MSADRQLNITWSHSSTGKFVQGWLPRTNSSLTQMWQGGALILMQVVNHMYSYTILGTCDVQATMVA